MNIRKQAYSLLLGCGVLMGMPDPVLAAKNCPVDLSYAPIYDSYWATEAEAIQHQFIWQDFLGGAGRKELEFTQDFTLSLKPKFEESKADPRSPVYGYHQDGSLDLDGGRKKSYNKNFKKFYLRYHGAAESKYPSFDPQDPIATQPLTFLFPETVKNIYEHNVPYFVERGFDIQGSDTFKKFKDQFIWTWPSGQLQEYGLPGYIAIKLIWDDENSSGSKKSDVPAYVDLHATANNTFSEYFVLETYQDNESKHKNGYGYPTRVPVTTNFCRFQKNQGKKAIAFYDKKQHVLTVHVPETVCTKNFLTSRVVDVGNPDLNVEYTEHLAGFDGSFKVFGRNECDKLAPTSLKKAELLAQVSDVVSIRSRVLENGQINIFESAWPIRLPILDNALLNYSGAVIGKMNGGSKAYDCYIEPIPDLNAYVVNSDPSDLSNQKVRGHHYHTGDNPVTRVVERYSNLSSTTLWDNEAWNFAAVRLPLDVLKGTVSYPENVATTAVATDVSAADAIISVNAHEFTHQAQFASGALAFLPSEAMAVGIELDTHASGDTFAPFRAGAFTQRLVRTMRGNFNAMRPDAFGLSTYGMGLWWKYIQDQFDHNNQVMRRTMDVLTSKTLGPLLEKNNIPDSFAADPVNRAGGSAALNRALGDLFDKNIKDVWNDYSVSITLLRNNTSIPEQWRNYFPYWIYNTQYAGFNKIVDSTAAFGAAQFADWWEKMDDNAVIPASYNTPYTGETFIPTLPEHFEADAFALSTYAFNVTKPSEGGPETITVTVPEGEWRVTLVQFTSDGTSVGSFIADGSHTLVAGSNDTITFDVANHSPAFSDSGNIRLICVNTTFDSNGKHLEDYFTEEAPNGSIVIDAPLV